MLTDEKISFNILSILKLHWGEGNAEVKGRPYHALSMRLGGDAIFTSMGQSYEAHSGDLVYVPRGVDYQITSRSAETVIAVHFDIADDHARTLELISTANPEIIKDLFIKMHNAWEKKEIGYEYRVEALFARVMEGLAVEAFHSKHGVKPHLYTLLEFIHSNYHDASVTVDSLARRMNISTTYLRRIFNSNLGTSPIKYLTRLRLERARQLLESGYYTVDEVAHLSGYNDSKYFSTLYKRSYGVSPSRVGD